MGSVDGNQLDAGLAQFELEFISRFQAHFLGVGRANEENAVLVDAGAVGGSSTSTAGCTARFDIQSFGGHQGIVEGHQVDAFLTVFGMTDVATGFGDRFFVLAFELPDFGFEVVAGERSGECCCRHSGGRTELNSE